MSDRQIVISEPNARVLRSLLRTRSAAQRTTRSTLDELSVSNWSVRSCWTRARLSPTRRNDARTVQVRDLESGRRQELTLVSPREADVNAGRISVLAPLGTALLGLSQGRRGGAAHARWAAPPADRRGFASARHTAPTVAGDASCCKRALVKSSTRRNTESTNSGVIEMTRLLCATDRAAEERICHRPRRCCWRMSSVRNCRCCTSCRLCHRNGCWSSLYRWLSRA